MKMKNETKLLKCPFCGGEGIILHFPQSLALVKCSMCGCCTRFKVSGYDAKKAWNTRKPMERILERLEKEKQKSNEKCKEIIHKSGHSLDYEFYNGKSIGCEKAIEIVKEEGGRVDAKS